MRIKPLLLIGAILFCLFSCVKPFSPKVTSTNYGYLVVEGMINLNDSTFINLSRTVTINSGSGSKAELKAVVSIESSTGTSYALTELGKGVYAVASLNLSAANKYRLRIKTSGGSTYVSDFTPAMPSPAIDSISWKAADNLQLFVSTHDPNNTTRYYRWDYSEKWEFHSYFQSAFISDGVNIVMRQPAQQIYYCYGGDTSHTVNLGTSAKLSNDVINAQLINTVDPTSEKLGTRYSLNVKQYALTKEAYDYWTLLKKNTEQLGGIFDSQPSSSIGNIHNINNASEVVIGYISAGTISNKRIFITRNQLPVGWNTKFPYAQQCQLDTVPYQIGVKGGFEYPQDEYINFKSVYFVGKSGLLIPLYPTGNATPPTYVSSAPICTDCTLRGTRTKPSYWP